MNSWEIIKEHSIKSTYPGTLGRDCALLQSGELFILLLPKLIDEEEATKSMDADAEMKIAVMREREIEELRKAGVIK